MRLISFRVRNYRNILDSGHINVSDLTALVGQNESGKSNLCDALYRVSPFDSRAQYNIDEDWPADKWGERDVGRDAVVCEATFVESDPSKIEELFVASGNNALRPSSVQIVATRSYNNKLAFDFREVSAQLPEIAKANAWAEKELPKCVYVHEYDLSGSQVELDGLAQRLTAQGWDKLNNEDQTILTILELAHIDLNDFIAKGGDAAGRTLRAFDKRQASTYLTSQFARLWKQKKVRFDIDVDATTLNIFVEDEGLGMVVRLSRRSTGFRWYVSFAWKFTHATRGAYKNSILLLEEPGVHLHHSGHSDLLKLFEELSESNTIIYTTHLSTMLDPAFPERVRIVEVHKHHCTVLNGMVSNQRQPMMVIEAALGLTGTMSGLLGNRQTLVVEGGDDALILQKLSGLVERSGKEGLSDRIYLFPAEGAAKTPMYAAFLVGNKFDAGVLLDSDKAGEDAKTKITDLYLKDLADGQKFRVLMLGKEAGIKKTDAAIEDLFPDSFYLECVNAAYRTAITEADLPADGSTQISKRVESVLQSKHARTGLDKALVMRQMIDRFEKWKTIADAPKGTAERVEKLLKAINKAFSTEKAIPGD